MKNIKNTVFQSARYTIELRQVQIFNYVLITITGIFIASLFLPWQQSVHGTGTLSALSPADRPQSIQTPIAGRIDAWFIREGQQVKKGDTIAILSEIKETFLDPELLPRLKNQVMAKEGVIQSTLNKAEALQSQEYALSNTLKFRLEQLANKVIQSQLKIQTDSIDLNAEKQNFAIADTQLRLGKNLFDKGLISLTEFQKRQEKFQQNYAKLISQENKLMESRNELLNAKIELNSIRADIAEKISKVQAERNSTLAYVADAEGDLAKLENQYSSYLLRSSFYVIRAPQDGIIVKAMRTGIGENVKEGETLVSIVPSSPQLAVELYVKAMDIPLLEKGQKVRLQFDGYPALVFSGWPDASLGTFGGLVEVIDFSESRKNVFRILVIEDPNDSPWPGALRMGSGALGWSMLSNVPVWYELWRRLNGFPAELPQEETSENAEKK
jgi:adhesin transport system membrane fusion protein